MTSRYRRHQIVAWLLITHPCWCIVGKKVLQSSSIRFTHQVLIKFQIQRNITAVVKSVSPHRIKENIKVISAHFRILYSVSMRALTCVYLCVFPIGRSSLSGVWLRAERRRHEDADELQQQLERIHVAMASRQNKHILYLKGHRANSHHLLISAWLLFPPQGFTAQRFSLQHGILTMDWSHNTFNKKHPLGNETGGSSANGHLFRLGGARERQRKAGLCFLLFPTPLFKCSTTKSSHRKWISAHVKLYVTGYFFS